MRVSDKVVPWDEYGPEYKSAHWSWWPPARRRERLRLARHTSLRWDFWFHWFARYRELEADLEATR